MPFRPPRNFAGFRQIIKRIDAGIYALAQRQLIFAEQHRNAAQIRGAIKCRKPRTCFACNAPEHIVGSFAQAGRIGKLELG